MTNQKQLYEGEVVALDQYENTIILYFAHSGVTLEFDNDVWDIVKKELQQALTK